MAQANNTYVQYFVPYDGDVEEHPNVFLVRKPAKGLTLADVQQSFPLPGTYFFRAKQQYGKTHVWLDLNAGDDAVPSFNGKVLLKVSRVSHATPAAARGGAVAAAAPDAVPARSAAVAAAAAPVGARASPAAAAAAPAVATAQRRPQPQQQADMLGLFDDDGGSGGGSASPAAAATAPLSASVPADIFSAPPPAARAPLAGSASASGLNSLAFSGGATPSPLASGAPPVARPANQALGGGVARGAPPPARPAAAPGGGLSSSDFSLF